MLQSALVGAVAQELVRDLSGVIQQQSQYAIHFQSQFEALKKQLGYMRSLVADAEKIKADKETVKTILTTLQELIYEADDLVVDCQIRADYQKLKESSCFPFFLSEISFRYRTGKSLTDINDKITKTKDDLRTYFTPIAGHSDSESSSKRSTPFSSQSYQSEMVGLKDDAEKIRNWILAQHEEPLLRIAIVGMGGLGKTTLAKLICEDESLEQRFRKKIWVSVSQHINENAILQSILTQLKVDDGRSPGADLLSRISGILSNESFLIVFDDVWNDGCWWDNISSVLPKSKGLSNCVIITSRKKKVVKGMGVKEERIHQPRRLNDTESWELFCAVFSPTPSNPQLVEKAKEIVKKCGGLPLAIKTIGGMLRRVDESFLEWNRICNNFHEMLMGPEGENSDGSQAVIASLRLSYDELPARLKQCLLCLSIYPEDHEIDAEQLIRWWQGEGFVSGKGTETAAESAYDCLKELISRCLVEVSTRRNFDGRISTCKVHDMVRDMTIKLAKEEEFCSFEEGGKHIADQSSRRLGVTSETLFQSLQGNSKLRALLLTTVHYIGFDKKIELAKVKSLRVLDISNIILDGKNVNVKDFWCWISSLKRLAYLNLRNVRQLFHVPQSIRKLWGLQVLILGECKDLQTLPKCITSLPRLTVLDVGDCPLKFLPEGFSRLSNLQELYGLKIGGPANTKCCRFVELENLTQLRILQVDITEESTIEDQELNVLEKLTNLRVLSIHAGDSVNDNILMKLDKLVPPMSIQELYLKHFFGEDTPAWINPELLQNLQFLCIEDSRVIGMNKKFWGDENHKWNVRSLSLKVCLTLQVGWEDLRNAMPQMEYLEVSQCSLLRGFPCDVRRSGTWDIREKKKKDAQAAVACTHED